MAGAEDDPAGNDGAVFIEDREGDFGLSPDAETGSGGEREGLSTRERRSGGGFNQRRERDFNHYNQVSKHFGRSSRADGYGGSGHHRGAPNSSFSGSPYQAHLSSSSRHGSVGRRQKREREESQRDLARSARRRVDLTEAVLPEDFYG